MLGVCHYGYPDAFAGVSMVCWGWDWCMVLCLWGWAKVHWITSITAGGIISACGTAMKFWHNFRQKQIGKLASSLTQLWISHKCREPNLQGLSEECLAKHLGK